MKINYVKSKKRNTLKKKTQKSKKIMKRKKNMKIKKSRKNMKGMKTMKNRIHLKHIPKRKLSRTLKKARKKIQKQLKKLYLKGGSKTPLLEGMELPQSAGQSPESMEALGGALIVGGQADQLAVGPVEVK